MFNLPYLLNTFSGFTIAQLTLILARNSSQFEGSPILKNIFKFKNQDLRRSAVYTIGGIGQGTEWLGDPLFGGEGRLEGESLRQNLERNTRRLKTRREVTNILVAVVNNRAEDINIRWVAAASLQEMNIDVNQFFVENKLVNPKTARWQFPHGETPWRRRIFTGGTIFDVYSGELLYSTRTGCGGGLLEIYNTLRNLLTPKKK